MDSVLQSLPCRLACALALFGLGGLLAFPPVFGAPFELATHHAVYRLTLEKSNPGSNISDVTGELTYDFKGSFCEGYTVSTRLVSTVYDREGKSTVQDIRAESYEKGDGSLFRFTTTQYIDDRLTELTKGKAIRARGNNSSVVVSLEKPKKETKVFHGRVLFPTQHSMEVLRAASAGLNRLQADLYDGSEKGMKLFETSTLIGAVIDPAAGGPLAEVKNSERLTELVAWPVLVSYYDDSQNKDGVPSYEISFRLYGNGVSRKIKLNYGAFSLSGDLVSLEFLPHQPCAQEQPLNLGVTKKTDN